MMGRPLLLLLAGAAVSQRIDRARDYPTTPVIVLGKGRWLKTCPFCGGDPSPVDCSNDARSPSPVDCSNDAAIALALSRRWA